MRPSRVLVALAAACLLSAATAEEELGELGEGSCVSSLDTGNFEAAIRGKNALVVFFAPWCGHCKALHPHFERLCADLSDQDEFLAAVVDATEEVELAQSHGVTGACLPPSVRALVAFCWQLPACLFVDVPLWRLQCPRAASSRSCATPSAFASGQA